MKKIKFITLAIAILGFTSISFAQNTANTTADASARILTHLKITKMGDLSFGNLIASGALGTAVIANDGTRTVTGGVSEPGGASIPGTLSAASFKVDGETDATYSISLPDPITGISLSNGTETMTVNAFTNNATKKLTLGTETFSVGATLNVAVGQAAGSYTGSFPITVAYN